MSGVRTVVKRSCAGKEMRVASKISSEKAIFRKLVLSNNTGVCTGMGANALMVGGIKIVCSANKLAANSVSAVR